MSNTKFNPNAHTPEECLANVQFQLENVEGYLLFSGLHSARESAAIKAKCLLRAAESLVAAFEAEARAARISAEQSAAVQTEAAKTPAAALPTAAGQPVARKKLAAGRWQVGRMLVEFDHGKTAEEVA